MSGIKPKQLASPLITTWENRPNTSMLTHFKDRVFVTDIGIGGSEWYYDGYELRPTVPIVLGSNTIPMLLPPGGVIDSAGVLTFPNRHTFSHKLVGYASSGTSVNGSTYFLGRPFTQSTVTLAAVTHAASTTYTVSAGTFDAGDFGRTLVLNVGGTACYLWIKDATTYVTAPTLTGTTLPTSSMVITPIASAPTSTQLSSSTSTIPATSGVFGISLVKLSVPVTTGSITLPPLTTAGGQYTLVSGSFDPADVGKEAVATSSAGTAAYYFTILSTTVIRTRSTTSSNFPITPAATIVENPNLHANTTASTWCIQDFGPNHVGCTIIAGSTSASNIAITITGIALSGICGIVPTAVTYAQFATNGAFVSNTPFITGYTGTTRGLVEKGYIYLEATDSVGNSVFSGNNPLTGAPYESGWYYYKTKGADLTKFDVYADMYSSSSKRPPQIIDLPTPVVGSGVAFYPASNVTASTTSTVCLEFDIPVSTSGTIVRNEQVSYNVNFVGNSITASKYAVGIAGAFVENNTLTGSTIGYEDNNTVRNILRKDGRFIANKKTLLENINNTAIHRPFTTLSSPKSSYKIAFTKTNINDYVFLIGSQSVFYTG